VSRLFLGRQHRLRHVIEAASALGRNDGHQLVLGQPLSFRRASWSTTPMLINIRGVPSARRLELGPPKQHHGESAVEDEEDGCAQDRTSNRVVVPDDAVLHGVGHGVDADATSPSFR
jgi:hypothetical protein